ncbi:MAG: BON domain-containing protein [Phaeospirillum sp.]|nr:BON domain-containing protein [Phaeospirillum sp.]
MKKSRLSLLLPVLLLAACGVTPGGEAPRTSAVAVDSSGRVIRGRAERNQDDSIGRNIMFQLRQGDAAVFKGVSVLAWDRAVLLTGAVAKPEHRRRVEQVAKAMDGVDTVFNDLIVTEIPDATAFFPEVGREQRIYAGLLGQTDISGAYVVRMVNGVVTLMGTARDAEDVAKAMAFAREVEGVKWVVNHVAVK